MADPSKRDLFFRRFATPEQKGAEIGAAYNPAFPKRDGWNVVVVDYLDKAGLTAKYEGGAIDVSQIEDVDHLVEGSRFSEGLKVNGLDYIAASHALEHLVDPVGFLQECASLLPIGGRVILAVPDKRFCFDVFRPLTTTAEMVRAHWDRDRVHPASAWLDSANLSCTSNGLEEWVIEHERPELWFRYPHARQAIYAEADKMRGSEAYRDLHRWVFTPSSLLFILRDLADQGLIQFEVEALERGDGPNIFVALRRTEAAATFLPHERLHLQFAMTMEQDVQNAFVASSAGFSALPEASFVEPMTRALMTQSRSELAYLRARAV